MKVLVVDDEPLARERMAALLAEIGDVDVVGEAGNGREMLEAVARLRPELVLLDINMPVMSGLEFLTHCKKEKVFQNIPVVIVSSEGNARDTILGIKAGAKGYLTKPFRPDDLYKLIDRIFMAPQK